ncbi:MAG: oligosaccharide flippase family protein [Thermodesulfobacteriota bacterium]
MSAANRDKFALSPSEGTFTLAKGTSLSFLGEIAHTIITYALGIVIAQFLGAGDFGVFSLGITIFNLVVLFSYCGIEDGLMRFIGLYVQNKEIDKAKGIIRFSLLASVGIGILFGSLCFFFAYQGIERFFPEPAIASVLRYLSLAIPISAIIVVPVSSLRGFKIVAPYVFVRKVFLPLISFIFTICALAMGYGLQGLAVTYVIAIGCTAVLSAFLLISFLSRFNKEKSVTPDLGKYLPFVGSALLVSLFLFLSNWSDFIVLGMLRSSQETGVYFAAKRTGMVLSFLLLSLNVIFAPVASHLYSGSEHTQLSHAYKTTTRWLLTLSLPLFLIMVFFSNEILSLFGPAFKAGSTCLIILAFANLIHVSIGSSGYLIMMTGNQKWMVFNSILFVIMAFFLTTFLVPKYGMLGAAYANACAMLLANIIVLLEVYFLLRLHPYNIRYFKVLCSGAITAAVTYLLIQCHSPYEGSLILLFVQCVLVFILFFALIILFGLEENEKKILWAIRKKMMLFCIRGSAGCKK